MSTGGVCDGLPMTSKVHYRPIEAAIRWSGLQRHEHQILRLGSRASSRHHPRHRISAAAELLAEHLGQYRKSPGERERDNAPHELQGEELGRFWSLPAPVVAATKAHHEPDSCATRKLGGYLVSSVCVRCSSGAHRAQPRLQQAAGRSKPSETSWTSRASRCQLYALRRCRFGAYVLHLPGILTARGLFRCCS